MYKRPPTLWIWKIIVLPVFVLAAPAGWAADSENQYFQSSKGQLRIGAFFIRHVNTKITVNPPKGPLGVILDTERDLGMENENVVPRLNFSYNFAPRHRLSLGWLDIKRSGVKVLLDKEIRFGQATFPLNAAVESYLDTEIFKINYSYIFFTHPKAAMGVGAGLHLTNLEVGIKTRGNLNLIQEDVSGVAPLPLLGFNVSYRISTKLTAAARTDVFFLAFDKYQGSMIDLSVAFEWRVFKRIGLGVGLNSLSLDVKMDDGELAGDFENTYSGALFYTAVYF